MARFEVMYGRISKVLLSWEDVEHRLLWGPQILKEIEEIVKRVKHNFKITQDH